MIPKGGLQGVVNHLISELPVGQPVNLAWCNLLNSAVLSWQGVGMVNSTQGGGSVMDTGQLDN